MKKFLNFKFLLIIIISIMGIFIFLNFGFNISNSKTYCSLNSFKNNYYLYYEIDNINNSSRKNYIYTNTNYYNEYSILESNTTPNYMHQEEMDGKKNIEIKGINIETTSGNPEKKFFSENYEQNLEISSKTNEYVYTNKLQDLYNLIENTQYYKKGYCKIDSIKYYYEEFKLKDNSKIKFYFENNDLKQIEQSNSNIIYKNINLQQNINKTEFEKAKNKFQNFNE